MFRRIEADAAGIVPLDLIRKAFEPHGARVRASVWWHGADLDRILDEAHAAVVERGITTLVAFGWATAGEVTFSEFGERGSVDALGFHPPTRSGLVAEMKASWGSLEETNRTLDVKVRLGAKLIEQRFGVRPLTVSKLLIFPDDMTLRRVAGRHAATLAAIYPVRGRAIRKWLRNPSGSISGLWFLSHRADSERQ